MSGGREVNAQVSKCVLSNLKILLVAGHNTLTLE